MHTLYKNLKEVVANNCHTDERLLYIIEDLVNENINFLEKFERTNPKVKERMGALEYSSEYKFVRIGTNRHANYDMVCAGLMRDYENSILLLPDERCIAHLVTSYPSLNDNRESIIVPDMIHDSNFREQFQQKDINLIIINNYHTTISGSNFTSSEEVLTFLDLALPQCNNVVEIGI